MDNAGVRAKGTQRRNERDEMTTKKRVVRLSISAALRAGKKEAFTCDTNKFVCTRTTFSTSGINRPLGEKFPSEAPPY